jgi:hypothetical protein
MALKQLQTYLFEIQLLEVKSHLGPITDTVQVVLILALTLTKYAKDGHCSSLFSTGAPPASFEVKALLSDHFPHSEIKGVD